MAQFGFGRIKIEKLEHIACMVFRKCFDPEIVRRWARMHKELYMEYKMEIPHDFTDATSSSSSSDENVEKEANITDNSIESSEIVAKSNDAIESINEH